MWGFPHSNEPDEIYEGELWARVTPNGWRPRIWAPMIEALRPMKPREERLIEKSTAMKPEPRILKSIQPSKVLGYMSITRVKYV